MKTTPIKWQPQKSDTPFFARKSYEKFRLILRPDGFDDFYFSPCKFLGRPKQTTPMTYFIIVDIARKMKMGFVWDYQQAGKVWPLVFNLKILLQNAILLSYSPCMSSCTPGILGGLKWRYSYKNLSNDVLECWSANVCFLTDLFGLRETASRTFLKISGLRTVQHWHRLSFVS